MLSFVRWLDVQEDDGQIERELDVCAGRFAVVLCFLVVPNNIPLRDAVS